MLPAWIVTVGKSGCEEAAAKPIPIPIKPTQVMIDAREVCHTPFRSWCIARVRGRAKSVGHKAMKRKEEEQVASLSRVYGFLGNAGEFLSASVGSDRLPILGITNCRGICV